ncbi:MAG: hypothetical protein ABSG03_06670 [Bryobacteraceae bacterium]|jgi:hypothetical protein
MALGIIGLSVSNTILILPPAAPAPNRLLMVYTRSAGNAIDQVSYPDYEYYRDNNHIFTDVAAAPNSIGLNDDVNFEGRDVKVITRPLSWSSVFVVPLSLNRIRRIESRPSPT